MRGRGSRHLCFTLLMTFSTGVFGRSPQRRRHRRKAAVKFQRRALVAQSVVYRVLLYETLRVGDAVRLAHERARHK